MTEDLPPPTLGTEMPDGVRFVGRDGAVVAAWTGPDHPADADLDSCVACGLCLPHCPTYRLTGEESASPRGRITAMRAVADGQAEVDDRFADFMDRCLVCRACEAVCPSHVPFGRMMEHARADIEPQRGLGALALRRIGLDVVLPRPSLVRAAAALQTVVRPFLPRRIRALVPPRARPFARLPAESAPPGGTVVRGTVALLAGCVQDRWFHEVNLATIGVLTRSGWRVRVPRAQRCCGALQAHNGRLDTARRLARRNASAFAGMEHVVVNSAGCGAHMTTYGELADGADLPVVDVMRFLHEQGLGDARLQRLPVDRVAYHDACHALRAQGIHAEPRTLLGSIPGLQVVEIADGDTCCGAAGLYNVTQPELSGRLRAEKAEALRESGAALVASANPGCTMQLRAGLTALGVEARVAHPIELVHDALA